LEERTTILASQQSRSLQDASPLAIRLASTGIEYPAAGRRPSGDRHSAATPFSRRADWHLPSAKIFLSEIASLPVHWMAAVGYRLAVRQRLIEA
jgi:hypothetical protein